MIKILHRGNQINLDLNTSTFTGVATKDNFLAYMESLKAGKLVGVDSNGKVALADGLTVKAIGFVVVDASANPVDNYPAVASKKLAVTLGDCVVETDQIEENVNITAGQLVYASATANKVGTLTNVQPTGEGDAAGSPIGVALTSCTAQVRTIQIAKF